MSWMIVAGAVIGGAGAYASSKGSSREGGEIRSASLLSPEQQSILDKISPLIEGNIGQGATPYTGQVVAGLTSDQQARLDALSKNLTPVITDYSQGKVNDDLWNRAVAEPTWRDFNRYTAPNIAEQFIGSGTYWGTPRANAVSQAASDVGYDLGTKRATLALEGPTRALQLNSELSSAEAIPRALKQAQLDWNYNEYLRTRPENSPYIGLAMQLLGMNFKENIVNPYYTRTEPWAAAVSGAAGGALGAMGNMGGGGAAPNNSGNATPMSGGQDTSLPTARESAMNYYSDYMLGRK